MPSVHHPVPVVDSDCLAKYKEMSKHPIQWRYTIFTLTSDETQIVVESVGAPDALFSDFVQALPPTEPRWALLDVRYSTVNGGKRNKLCFINWCPDAIRKETLKETARVKTGNVLWAGKLKKDFRANDFGDLDVDTVLSKVARHERDPIDPLSIH